MARTLLAGIWQKAIALSVALSLLLSLKAQDDPKATGYKYVAFPNDFTLPPGGEADFSLKFVSADLNMSSLDPSVVIDWNIDGHNLTSQDAAEGNLHPLASGAHYKAPSSAPPHNPVLITASFLASENPMDPTAGKTRVILYCYIHIIDEPNFFYIGTSDIVGGGSKNTNGSIFKVKEPMSLSSRQSAETAIQANDQWNIHVNGVDERGEQVTIQANFSGSGVGSYPWKVTWTRETGITMPSTGASVFAMGGTLGSIHYISTDCTPHTKPDDCTGITLPGTITVKTFDTKNKKIQGYFYGQMRNGDQYMFVSGGFSAFMRY